MSDINKVLLVGRVVKDAELKYAGESAVCRFSIAVNRSRKDQYGAWTEEAYFFDVTHWGKGAEALSRYLAKGKQIALEGSLRQERWTDQNGNQRAKVVVNADNIQLCGGVNPGENQGNFTPPTARPIPQPDHFDDDGIPF